MAMHSDDGGGAMERWDDESHRQMKTLDIFPYDGLTDNAEEIFGFLIAEGIKNVVITGSSSPQPLSLSHESYKLFYRCTLSMAMV